MSRQVTISNIFALTVLLGSTGIAQNYFSFSQNYSQLGMMSGSGMVFTPSTVSSPAAQFRLQLGRLGLTEQGGRGMNVVAVSAGFSPFLEGYVKFTSEQVGSLQSVGTVGIGAKFTIPYIFPLVHLVSLWGESSTTPDIDRSQLYSPGLSRGAVIVTPFANELRSSILVGATKDLEGNIEPMEGASLSITSGHSLQWGIEYLHGYNGVTTHHVMLNSVIRVLPYVSLNLGPGYVSSPAVSGWMWSVGISVNTSDIDFRPVEKKHTQEYKLPTIEELEKGTTEEPPSPSEDKKNE